jgi:hypothetical protein
MELEYYYRPTGLPREQQPWLASVWRRPQDCPVMPGLDPLSPDA